MLQKIDLNYLPFWLRISSVFFSQYFWISVPQSVSAVLAIGNFMQIGKSSKKVGVH